MSTKEKINIETETRTTATMYLDGEVGILGGIADIAGGGDVDSTTDAGSVDSGDDGLVADLDGSQTVLEFL